MKNCMILLKAILLDQCQFKMTGCCIWCMVLRVESGPVTEDLTTIVVHTCSYKLLINDVKHFHYLNLYFNIPLLETVLIWYKCPLDIGYQWGVQYN